MTDDLLPNDDQPRLDRPRDDRSSETDWIIEIAVVTVRSSAGALKDRFAIHQAMRRSRRWTPGTPARTAGAA
jgi:hypothetical protein